CPRLSPYHASHCSLYGHGAHRDLHSFPTRRSSDLTSPKDTTCNWPFFGSRRPGWEWASTLPRASGDASRNARASWSISCFGPSRSEEHTSELQSRENLVCRLLLEKKKNNIQTHHHS